MKFDSFILDVDGTLWDSTGIVAKAWTDAVRKAGYPEFSVDADRLKGLFGRTMTVIADSLFPNLEQQERYRLLDFCCEAEHTALEENDCRICYPDVLDTIREMSREYQMFIVSNCQSGYIELFLEKTGLGCCIKDIECFGNTGKSKGENIRAVVNRNHLKRPAYVGDTIGDCDAAHEADVPFIFAEYGFGNVDPKACAATISDFTQLKMFGGIEK